MSTRLTKASAIMAFVIGAMAVFAGGKVLLGQVPDYYVIDWVPVYNFSVGLITAAFTAIVIWQNGKLALPAAIATLSSHSIVMIVLQTIYRDIVAPDSIQAMTIRITVWIIILTLLLIQAWINRGTHAKKIQAQGLSER